MSINSKSDPAVARHRIWNRWLAREERHCGIWKSGKEVDLERSGFLSVSDSTVTVSNKLWCTMGVEVRNETHIWIGKQTSLNPEGNMESIRTSDQCVHPNTLCYVKPCCWIENQMGSSCVGWEMLRCEDFFAIFWKFVESDLFAESICWWRIGVQHLLPGWLVNKYKKLHYVGILLHIKEVRPLL